MKLMKILINTTPPTNSGGVANHYKGLKKYWNEEVYYNYIGRRKGVPGYIILWFDLIKFAFKLITLKPDVVLLNPSLGKTAIKRDGLFLRVSNIVGTKTIVYFHGWDQKLAKDISNTPHKFVQLFNRADKILVLASEFKDQFISWGITKPVSLTSTKVDDELVFRSNPLKKEYGQTILFLARVEKVKGVFIALKAFKEIKKIKTESNLIIAGSGSALESAKKYVIDHNLQDVTFTGYIRGEELTQVFKSSDLYLFPTMHGEGMPTSVLEAMAFGLPVISRPVGGMVDFFENGKMGYLIESIEPDEYATETIEILANHKKLQRIGHYNYQYAKEHFYASHVAKQLEGHFKSII